MIDITVNSDTIAAALRQLAARVDNLEPVLAGIGMELESRISDRFERQVDPLGGAWTTWAPATLASYPNYGNRRLLDRSGDMLNSLTHQASADQVRIGFGMAYATYHEFGTARMPRRGLLFADPEAGQLAPEDEAAVINLLLGYLGAP